MKNNPCFDWPVAFFRSGYSTISGEMRAPATQGCAELRAARNEPLRQAAAPDQFLGLRPPVVVPDVHAGTLADKEDTFWHVSPLGSNNRARHSSRLDRKSTRLNSS